MNFSLFLGASQLKTQAQGKFYLFSKNCFVSYIICSGQHLKLFILIHSMSYHIIYKSSSEMMNKLNPHAALDMKSQGATQKTVSQKGRYPFKNKDKLDDDRSFMTPLKKKDPASLAKETQSTKDQLLASIASKPITSENEANRNHKIDKSMLVVRRFITISEPVLNIAARRARDEEIAKKKQLNKNKSRHHAVVLFQVIQEDNPEKVTQSIQCITALFNNPKYSTPNRRIYTQIQISQYFRQILVKCSTKVFFRRMVELLKRRICEIAEELPKSFPTINGRVEIISLVLKTILQFQEYLPPQDYSYNSNLWHIYPKFFSTLLEMSTKQFNIIKNLFLENYPNLTYISNGFQIHDLVMTYYILLLKNKFLRLSLAQIHNYPLKSTLAEFKARKLKVTERRKNEMIEEGSITLSELYANRRQVQKSKKLLSSSEIIDTFELFQEIQQSNIKRVTAKHLKIQMLANKYRTQARAIVYKYQRFINRKKAYLRQYNSNLSNMKDELITKQLIRNPNCYYEQVLSHIYYRNGMYVEQSYFEGNVHRLLEKETHYQQLRYLEKMFRQIIQRKEKGNVFFIDRCSLIENRESSAIVAVSIKGTLHCKESSNSLHFLKEVRKLLKTQQSSIIILFDDEFPFSARLEEKEDTILIRRDHSLCFLPRIFLVPNPCMAIANNAKQMFTEQCSLEEALQAVLKEFTRLKVMEVTQNEWEKAQRLAFPDNPQYNQQSETNKDEMADQNIEESSDLDDNQDEEEDGEEDEEEDEDQNEDNTEEVKFPRQSNSRFSSPNSQPLIMENLSQRSVSQLQLALTRLLQLNRSNSKNP